MNDGDTHLLDLAIAVVLLLIVAAALYVIFA